MLPINQNLPDPTSPHVQKLPPSVTQSQPQIFSLPPKLTPLDQIPVCSVSELEMKYCGLNEVEM